MIRIVPHQYSLWTVKSINAYFKTALSDYHCHFEGFQRDTEGLSEWFEVRVDGPNYRQQTRKDYTSQIQINLLAMIVENTHAYRTRELLGIAAEKLVPCIDVYKLGDPETDPLNTQEKLGCYVREQQKGNDIDIAYFGKVQPQTAMQQGSVEATYVWHFSL